jgi:two-component system LytT family response regulator
MDVETVMEKTQPNNQLKAIIVDDEFHGRENLKKIIELYCPEVTVLGSAESTVQAAKYVRDLKPDVVFLDINMPVLDGFDFLSEFEDRDFMAVLVSAYSEYGIKAVKAGAVDYLLKPVNIKELKLTVKKLISLKKKQIAESPYFENDKLVVPDSHGFNIINLDEIIRIEADGSYSKIHLIDGKSRIVTKTLKDFEDSLPETSFFRVHKSHIVNLQYVKEFSGIDGGTVKMTDGSKVEVSRRKVTDFVKKIKSGFRSV